MSGGTRVALISSPRAGNTWTRYLLSDACGLVELAEHNPWDVDWDALPERCVLQMHGHRTPYVLDALARHGFVRLHLARHPLDLLLSILQCCKAIPETTLWVNGEGGDEDAIRGCSPQDPAFLDYALGPRAQLLLSITPQWWNAGDPAVRLRYEDLVSDTRGRLAGVIAELGLQPVAPLDEVVESNRIERLRINREAHFWKGTPGLWRRVLTAPQVESIMRMHPAAFAVGGYAGDADPTLTAARAEENWQAQLSPADLPGRYRGTRVVPSKRREAVQSTA